MDDASSTLSSPFSLLRLPSAVQIYVDPHSAPVCTIPILRLQSCCLVSIRFLLYSEVNSPILKLRTLPSGQLSQSLRLPGNVLRLEATDDSVLVVMNEYTAIVQVAERMVLISCEKTCENPWAAGAVRKIGNGTVACVLDEALGGVVLTWIGVKANKVVVAAHKSRISAVGIDSAGRRFVTASSRGTLLRVYDAHSGKMQRELRLSYSCQHISSLAFSPDDRFIGVETQDGRVTLVEVEERAGLLGIVPSFLLPSCQAEERTEQCPLLQPLIASWLEIE